MSKVIPQLDFLRGDCKMDCQYCHLNTTQMDKRIIEFMDGQKVATICCIDKENKPYCFSCFYAFDEEAQMLYFKTSSNTYHAPLLVIRPTIAGTIQPDKLNPLAIKGIQFTGTVVHGDHASTVYHKKYPFALAMAGEVWAVDLHYIKMTDNTLSFGKKIIWEKEVAETAK